MLPSSVFGKESMRVMWMIIYHTLNSQNDIQQPHASKVVCFVKLWGCDLTMVATSVDCVGLRLVQSVFTVTFNEINSSNSCPNFLPVRQPLSIFAGQINWGIFLYRTLMNSCPSFDYLEDRFAQISRFSKLCLLGLHKKINSSFAMHQCLIQNQVTFPFSHYGHYLVSALAAERSRGTPGRWVELSSFLFICLRGTMCSRF